MKSKKEENKLIIFLEGELSSNNVLKTEEEINRIIENEQPNGLIIDIINLHYISSAGLRLMLKYKKAYEEFEIINASLEVYDIFQMTGFTDIMNISRALKEIDISNATLIGEGYYSNVYQIDKDTIIKVFKFATDIKEVERELKLGKEAFILGIPTAITYDIVRVKDKYGARFELLDCVLLRDVFRDNPDKYDEMLEKYVALIKKINSTKAIGDLPSTKQEWLKKTDGIKEFLQEKDYIKLKSLLNSIEERDTFIHGDCHMKNVMYQNDEMLIIDMDTLSYGHPIFELASLYAAYVAFEEDDEGNSLRFFGLDNSFTKKLYNDVAHKILGEKDSSELRDAIALVCYTHMIYWDCQNEPDNIVRLNGCKERLVRLLHKIDKIDY